MILLILALAFITYVLLNVQQNIWIFCLRTLSEVNPALLIKIHIHTGCYRPAHTLLHIFCHFDHFASVVFCVVHFVCFFYCTDRSCESVSGGDAAAAAHTGSVSEDDEAANDVRERGTLFLP